MSCSWGPAAPGLSEDKRSAPGAALRGPGHTATDRSPHEKHASTHHRGSQRGADQRSAPDSNTVPSAGPCAAPDAARASRLFEVVGNVKVVFEDLTLENGQTTNGGTTGINAALALNDASGRAPWDAAVAFPN